MLSRTEKKKRKKIEFSKLVLALVMTTYFFGVGIGAFVVFKSSSELSALLTFIGAPVATALGFYYWKAKNENMRKHDVLNEPNYVPNESAEGEGP